MARSILVGFDGSPWAHSAALMAGWLAKQSGARLSVLRAVTPPEEPRSSLVADFKAALAAVDAEVAALRRRGIQADGLTLVHEPVRLMMRAIAEQEPLLVALGTFGRQPVENWLLGSVADKLARSAPVPVLLMPAPAYEPPPLGRCLRVLVPVDGSLAAPAAIEAIERVIPASSCETTLLEVLEHPVTVPVTFAFAADGHPAAHRMVMDIVEDVVADTGKSEMAVRVRQPAQQIIEFGEDGGYDLIAMTRFGLGGDRQMLLGRIAEAVVRQSSLPVLVIPPSAQLFLPEHVWPEAVGA